MVNIIWTNRYSQTDESDDLGRWARVGYLENKTKDPMRMFQIAWINKVEIKGVQKFLADLHIGSTKFYKTLDTIDEAKEYCQENLNKFYNDYLL